MESQIDQALHNPLLGRLAILILGIVLTWVIVHFVQQKLLSNIKDNDNRYRANKIGGFIGYFFTVIIVIFVFSDQLQGFTVALGVAGAGIAFALQEVIASFAGWLAIMFGNFFKSGDRVQVGGIKGDVMDIGMLRTTIMETGEWVNGDLYNGRIVLIANSFVFKEPVFNYSGEFPFLWDELQITFQYGGDFEKAKEILLLIGKETMGDLSEQSKNKWRQLQLKYRLEDAQTDPMVFLVADNSGVIFTLRYVVDYKKRRITKTALYGRLIEEVEKQNGALKFQSPVLQITEMPDLKVQIKDKPTR